MLAPLLAPFSRALPPMHRPTPLPQLARSSKAMDQTLRDANVVAELPALLGHRDPVVRAKACNFVGNLCRHSSAFYGAMGPLLPSLLDCCSDSDPSTRKFACFALGNAAYHSDELYPLLEPAVPVMVQRLGDADEKTRANAAGALGNLVRNADRLCALLLRSEADEELLNVAMHDSAASPRRIALFSLGNLASYPACRAQLQAMEGQLETLMGSSDSDVTKYAKRMLDKLNGRR